MGGTNGKAAKAGNAGRNRVYRSVAGISTALAVAMMIASPVGAQSYSFDSVQVEGNSRIDTGSIVSYAGISRGEAISAAALNDAYQRVVASGQFETVELVPQGGTLVIRVKELPTVNVVSFQGNNRLKDEVLAEVVDSRTSGVFSPAQAESDAAAIAEAYAQSGRAAAEVEPKVIRRSENRVDLVFEIAEGKVVENERISFVGNSAFSDRRLRGVLETKQAGFLRRFIQRDSFVPERLEFDKRVLTDFYRSRGYMDFEVVSVDGDLAEERDASFVTFTVNEGQSFRYGTISAVSEVEGVDAAEFQRALVLRSGSTFSPTDIENNIARLENLVLRKGLNFVRVDPRLDRNEAAGTVDVTFALVRGERVFVERIDIEGNTTTLDQVVRRQFRTVEGDPFNPREVRAAAERIRALGYFADAQVNTREGASPDQVIVDVELEETTTGSLSFGASYGVSSGFGVNVGFQERNFLGRGQTFGMNITTGTDSSDSSLTFIEPAFLGRDLRFKFNAAYNTSENDNNSYSTRVVSLSPALEFPLSDQTRLELRYTASSENLFNVGTFNDGGTPNDPSDDTYTGSSPIIVSEEGKLLKSSLGYTFNYDTRRGGLSPNTRYQFRFGQDFVGVGGDVTGLETTVFASAERKIRNDDVTLRVELEGGAISFDEGSRVTDRYFGNGKIRGFEPNGIGPRDLGAANDDALGGNAFAVARFEAEFPIGLPEEYGLTGGAFLDVGSVWSLDDTAGAGGTVDDSMNLRSAVGLSLFWTTPIGPLRFNFSKALAKEDYDEEQSFDLTISTRF
ncbi:MAG: outer membrane protein assembly factor BamA [Paracoccaceae bacterium]